jgi:hypothetical protein
LFIQHNRVFPERRAICIQYGYAFIMTDPDIISSIRIDPAGIFGKISLPGLIFRIIDEL